MNKIIKTPTERSDNSDYTLRSSLPSVAAVLGLRHIFSEPAFGLFGAEKTSHSRKRYVKYLSMTFNHLAVHGSGDKKEN
jgi:hypothetical protein